MRFNVVKFVKSSVVIRSTSYGGQQHISVITR